MRTDWWINNNNNNNNNNNTIMYQLCSCLSVTGLCHRCHVLSSLTVVQSSSHSQHCVSTATFGDMASHRSYLRLLETHLRKKSPIFDLWPLSCDQDTQKWRVLDLIMLMLQKCLEVRHLQTLWVNWNLYSCTDASGNLYLFMAWNTHGRSRRGYENIFYQRWVICS